MITGQYQDYRHGNRQIRMKIKTEFVAATAKMHTHKTLDKRNVERSER